MPQRSTPAPIARLARVALGLALTIMLGAHAIARDESPEEGPDESQSERTAAQQPPPMVRLGLRANALQQRLGVLPAVVIVETPMAYLGALEGWSLEASYPVLIDDGTPDARENIARFVRAFEPASIVRWAPEGAGNGKNKKGKGKAKFTPSRDQIEGAVARFWGAPSTETLDEQWARMGFAPPGVVVMSEDDGAWTAGVALAIQRGQPIVWTSAYRRLPRAQLAPEELETLDRDLRAGLEARPWPWDALGDAIDSVAICLSIPSRIDPPAEREGDFALTDRVGRHADGSRYAWASVLFGDEATAAYRAMCALFLAPDHGWVFDGYEGGDPEPFDAGLAIPLFERMGFDVVFTESKGANLPTWRARCRTGIRGGFVHVNSAGYPRWFEVARRERAWASEVPLLREPAIVHFIHSFSAKMADTPQTISGRWLENGAYAYAGAVDEPYLQGFVPAEKYFARMFTGIPFAAACRYDDAPAWKLQVIGDPLIVAGKARPRRAGAPPLEGAEPLEAAMKAALEERRFADAAASLVMLGRDDDALRVARAALDDLPDEADGASLAESALLAAFRAGDETLFMDLYERLPPKAASRELYTSALWQLLRPSLEGAPDARVVNLLRAHIRDDSVLDDAWDLRSPVALLYGREAMEAMVLGLIERTRNQKTKERLREVMSARPLE